MKWYPKIRLSKKINDCNFCRGVGLVFDKTISLYRDCAFCKGTGKVKKDEFTVKL